MTIPHSKESGCPGYLAAKEANWPTTSLGYGEMYEFGLDLSCSAHQIDTVLDATNATEFLSEEQLALFGELKRAVESARATDQTFELPLTDLKDSFSAIAKLIREPPWQLRKKHRLPEGQLPVAAWALEVADALRVHEACAAEVRIGCSR